LALSFFTFLELSFSFRFEALVLPRLADDLSVACEGFAPFAWGGLLPAFPPSTVIVCLTAIGVLLGATVDAGWANGVARKLSHFLKTKSSQMLEQPGIVVDSKMYLLWLVVGGWWLVVGGWWLVVGVWWLVVGGWWLVVGGWWLVVGG
jgi:hypothetical protein